MKRPSSVGTHGPRHWIAVLAVAAMLVGLLVAPAPAQAQPGPEGYLKLTSMCSDDPDEYRAWRVRNMHGEEMDFT
jgi:hypothetical protein